MSMASLESLERTLGRFQRQDMKLLEHEPARELVAAKDIVRTDGLGRSVVACPAGQVPPTWLTLTTEERDALVEPHPRSPAAT